MSKICNEYGTIDYDISCLINRDIIEMTGTINKIIQDHKLNGEEINQIYHYVIGSLDCSRSEQTIRYGIENRKSKQDFQA